MEIQNKENIELKFLSIDDYKEITEAMLLSYEMMPKVYKYKEKDSSTWINSVADATI